MAKSKNQEFSEEIPAKGIAKARNEDKAVHYQFEKERNRAVAYDHNEHEVGECTFFKIKNLWTINHTFVDPDIRGQNVAAYLIKIIVEQARNENVKIIPLCSFAKKEFMKIDEYKDILYY
jgi:predicted GNAT family acetyltransferase